MRIKPGGEIFVSANKYVPLSAVDEFVISKAQWIEKARTKIEKRQIITPDIDDEVCNEYFEKISGEIYPIFKKHLPKKPVIVVKNLKSAWGICHYKQNYIVINKALYLKPKEAAEYVMMHEYVHFLEPNHQKGFHTLMQKLMPDYMERKKLLK